MKIQPNFTAKYEYSKNDDERKQVILKDSYLAAEGLAGAGLTYGVLETIDKRKIAQNTQKHGQQDLINLAKKNSKHNVWWAILAGVVCYAITWPIHKLYEPMLLKLYRWADKQTRIAEKAEQLVNEEDKNNNTAHQ